MIIKLPMILKPLGPSFWLLQFFLSNNHRKLWKLWTLINFSTAKSGFFYKKKNIKDYKDHFCMEITSPPEKKGTVSFGPAIVFVYSANRIISYTTFYVSNVKTDFGKIS